MTQLDPPRSDFSGTEPGAYLTGSRGNSLFVGCLFLAVGGIAASTNILWLFGILPINAKAQPTMIFDFVLAAAGVVVGALSCPYGWRVLRRRAYEVVLTDGGMLCARTVVRVIKVPVFQIQSIYRATAGENIKELRIRYPKGAITVPYFDQAEELVARLVTGNPAIIVEGAWSDAH